MQQLDVEGTLTWDEIMKESPHRQNRHLVMEHDVRESDWESEGPTKTPWEVCSESGEIARSVPSSPKVEALVESTPVPLCRDTDRGLHGAIKPGCCTDTHGDDDLE